MAAKLLIVEDDSALQKSVNDLLQAEGYITETASSGADALRKIEKTSPDLILLDLGLPDIQGESILKIVREDYPEMPVIILTAKSKPQEIAAGLNLGADDYLAKPFAVEELLARINVRLKRRAENGRSLDIGDLALDLSKMVATRNGKEIILTKTEFSLLEFLMQNQGRVLSRDVILNHVWGYSSNVESRVVDIYIGYLRKKIDEGASTKLIKNKRGFGYLIDA
jgi:two-component system response regulator MprA